jgi:YihY family inner membrane protein
MSTANLVPETHRLSGDDAKETLQRTGLMQLFEDAFRRLRYADGFSHARSLVFAGALVFIQATIAVVGIASLLGKSSLSQTIVRTLNDAAPGPAGTVLTDAVRQAHQAGHGGSIAFLVGLIGALISGTTLMGQLERGLNRIYGIEQDRPTAPKYVRAFVLAVTAGVLGAIAFAAMAFGNTFATETAGTIWNLVRWPVGLVLLAASVALLFRWAPNRRQPAWSWLAYGAAVAVILATLSTVILTLFFSWSHSFGKTYGPLAGMIALLIWLMLVSVSVLYGGAVGAQLEAVRAGVPQTRDRRKVTESVPVDVSRSAAVA